jgi:hypothetical protein
VAPAAPQPAASSPAASIAQLDEPGDSGRPPAAAPPPAPTPAPEQRDEFGDLAAEEPLADDFDLDDAEDLELIEDEIIDITDLDEDEARAIAADAAEEEGVPLSSPRPKAPESMDEALTNAAQQLGEREVPLKTPPPESGDQVATPVAKAPKRHKPGELLEVGDELPQRDLGAGPTPEQLGETIDLDEPLGPALELDTAKAQPPPVAAPPSPLEEPIVSVAAGAFDEKLELPPEAAADMAKHRAREAAAAPVQPPAQVGQVTPDVVQRPALAAVPTAFATAATGFHPQSFGELLDESLSL